jgi:sulfite exporter TauE/SafE
VSIALGVALLACLLASRKLALWQPMTGLVQQLKTKMGLLLRRRSFATLVLLGLLNGLLPCGLVYVAGAGATATGGVLSSLAYMATFGAGTVPMMLAISLSGKLVPFSIRLKLARLIPVSVFLLAMLLILRGLSLGIPYLSPDLAAGSCCSR